MEFRSNMTFDDLLTYCVFPNSFIRNGQLTLQERMLFEILCSYDHIGTDGTRKGWCNPSLERLSQDVGLKVRAVQVHIKRLVEKGMVVIVYRNNVPSDVDGKSSIYILNILPGLSESDRTRIAKCRNIQIKNMISGLNTVRVRKSDGFHNIVEEEFDLQYLLTGTRSDTIIDIEGDIIDGKNSEKIITKEEERKLNDKTLYGYGGSRSGKGDLGECDGDCDISFKQTSGNSRAGVKSNHNQYDPLERLISRKYTNIKGEDICRYFAKLYETAFVGEQYFSKVEKTQKDQEVISRLLDKIGIEKLIPLMEFFVTNYRTLFYHANQPRPRIKYLEIDWIITKAMATMVEKEKVNKEVEHINRKNKEEEIYETIQL